MPPFNIVKTWTPDTSFRTQLIKSQFTLQDIKLQKHFVGEIPIEGLEWKIGLIVGRSGTGKSTIAKQLFPDAYIKGFQYTEQNVPTDFPKETEIDQLIAGCSKRMATFLQTLKETGSRCGEVWRIKWDDIDFESKVVNITPEKNSNPRVTHLSDKLLDMLRQQPKNYGEYVFSRPNMRVDNHAVTFQQQRKRIAKKIGNPRILKIHFHTLRHFKGTMLYHKTKDLLYVMQALGHKNIKNTLLYIQLEEALFQGEIDYISKVAKTPGEICVLIEAGFEYVTEFEGLKFFRKRKT